MQKWTNRVLAAATMLLLNGAAAFAQSDMTLDVPFAFQTPKATMQPGPYQIRASRAGATTLYWVRNMETGQSTLVASSGKTYRKAGEPQKAQVAFRCAGENCALSSIYNAFASTGDVIYTKLRLPAKDAQVAEIRILASE